MAAMLPGRAGPDGADGPAGHDGTVVGGGSTGWQADTRSIRHVAQDPGLPVDTSRWPGTVPAVAQEDLYLVSAWRRFLTEPASYFRHLLAD
jgi:hypothetical protein